MRKNPNYKREHIEGVVLDYDVDEQTLSKFAVLDDKVTPDASLTLTAQPLDVVQDMNTAEKGYDGTVITIISDASADVEWKNMERDMQKVDKRAEKAEIIIEKTLLGSAVTLDPEVERYEVLQKQHLQRKARDGGGKDLFNNDVATDYEDKDDILSALKKKKKHGKHKGKGKGKGKKK